MPHHAERLAGESSYHDITVRDLCKRNLIDIAQYHMCAKIRPISLHCKFIKIIGPDDLIASIQKTFVQSTQPAEKRYYLHLSTCPRISLITTKTVLPSLRSTAIQHSYYMSAMHWIFLVTSLYSVLIKV